MECNKEEAIRAKIIAENKMKNNDFAGAYKMAIKAQKLCSDLANISQMVTVCEVHCSSEKKFVGNEMDWYAILQIEQTADEGTIKKQYRKFALQLHPDKNKFPGAETAFKLIGEAQRVLLDQGRRSVHDMKRTSMSRPASRPAPPYYPPQKSACYSNVGAPDNLRSNFTGFNFQRQKQQQPVQPGIFNCSQTFWTMCPFCTRQYQHFRTVINSSVFCESCKKQFFAYEKGGQGVPMATNLHQPVFCPQKDVPGACKVEQVFKGNFAACSSKTSFSHSTSSTSYEFGSAKVNGKRGRKQVVEPNNSCDTESSSDSEEDMAMDENGDFQGGQNSACFGDKYPRRSGRQKQQVSYKENFSDDDDILSHPKRAKRSGSSCATEEDCGEALKEKAPKMDKQSGSATAVKEEQKVSACFEGSLPNGNKETAKVSENGKAEEDGCEKSPGVPTNDLKKRFEVIDDCTSDSSSESAEDPEVYTYPDPDFNDFDKDRKDECFMAGQIWAAYDTVDAMPRFYAWIRKVFSSGFKLRITWLEPDPDDANEVEWVNSGLPTSCGKFKYGNSEITEDRLMFSHIVSWEKGSNRDTLKVFPKKGEVWGLFKNWNFNWKSEADANRKYEYEFVEILSDYAEGVGTRVAYLAKVKGFACVFCRKSKEGTGSLLIPSGELFRFSHMVPSFTLTGEEREDVLKGYFELDPASLPLNLEEIVPEILKAEAGTCSSLSLGSSDQKKPLMGSGGCSLPMDQAGVSETLLETDNDRLGNDFEDCSAPPASNTEAIEIPDPEFYNFDAEKSKDHLQVGQIWSLYSDEDGLPKYYGEIFKIEYEPSFKLVLRWLENCSLPNNSIRWHNEDMPISCGRFKVSKYKLEEYSCTSSFSHQVRAIRAAKQNEYTIFPRKGEFWALYRNWTAEMKCSDLENCEYDIVQILNENDTGLKVLYLERLDGFKSVFKPQVKGASAVIMDLPLTELLRFSHQIPVFQLTEERGGSLRGFWELDPAALPVYYFLS